MNSNITKNNTEKKVGYILKRYDIDNIRLADFFQELRILLFEANIIKHTIEAVLNGDILALDSSVGDWKCQTRASMIVDIMEDSESLNKELVAELLEVNYMTQKLTNVINIGRKREDLKHLKTILRSISLQSYLDSHELNYNPATTLSFLSLCFLTAEKNSVLPILNPNDISKSKMDKLIILGKRILMQISIDYERTTAEKYGSSDEIKALQQIEYKNFRFMSSCFVSFKCIFRKMLIKKQPFVVRCVIFCNCGGVVNTELKFFAVKNDMYAEVEFGKVLEMKMLNQVITVMEGYQFPGSMGQLKNILHVPHNETYIPKNFYRLCICSNKPKYKTYSSISEAIMAFFAQHTQFINHASIDFEGLGISSSELQKSYEQLLTIPGLSLDNMSTLLLHHIYADTIKSIF